MDQTPTTPIAAAGSEDVVSTKNPSLFLLIAWLSVAVATAIVTFMLMNPEVLPIRGLPALLLTAAMLPAMMVYTSCGYG